MNRAREAANTVKCASNLRSVGQGIATYAANFRNTLPNSYVYDEMSFGPNPNGWPSAGTATMESPTQAFHGYLHWSAQINGFKQDKSIPVGAQGPAWTIAGAGMFVCPSMSNGGLPPTNPVNPDPGQAPEAGDFYDKQPPRMAYTLNEALCGRNKFEVGFQSAVSTYRFVPASQVSNAAGTILATEFVDNGVAVSDAARNGGATAVIKSHRPVHAFRTYPGTTYGSTGINMENSPKGHDPIRVTADDVTRDLNKYGNNVFGFDPTDYHTRLDWVGHNHGSAASYARKSTNFLYLDGHVETKNVLDTLNPWQWGEKFYSLNTDVGNTGLNQ